MYLTRSTHYVLTYIRIIKYSATYHRATKSCEQSGIEVKTGLNQTSGGRVPGVQGAIWSVLVDQVRRNGATVKIRNASAKTILRRHENEHNKNDNILENDT